MNAKRLALGLTLFGLLLFGLSWRRRARRALTISPALPTHR